MEATTSHILDFKVEQQEGSLMCWAAVSVSVARFYNPSFAETQQTMAVAVFGENGYDRVCDPRKALDFYGNLKAYRESALSIEEIETELRSGNPVAACMRFFIGWHLVVIYGIDTRGNLLIEDPLHGNQVVEPEIFKKAYLENYSWTHTCLLKR